jgi:hypothetical protein
VRTAEGYPHSSTHPSFRGSLGSGTSAAKADFSVGITAGIKCLLHPVEFWSLGTRSLIPLAPKIQEPGTLLRNSMGAFKVNVPIRAGGRVAKWRGGWAADRIRRKVRAEISQHAKKGMNGFALYSWAKNGLKYDCRNLPKMRKGAFSVAKSPLKAEGRCTCLVEI